MAFHTDFYKNIKQNFMVFYELNVHAGINNDKLFTALSSQSETLWFSCFCKQESEWS